MSSGERVTEPSSLGPTLADRMRRHAGDSQHLYGHLMREMADDLERGGPVREICAGWEDAPKGWAIQLRILAGLFRLVLTGRAPEIVAYYPCLGGSADPAAAWPAVRKVLSAHVGELQASLEIAPQTNEVGRSNALIVGLFRAAERTGRARIRLLEPGSSAGLNLLVDEFRFVNPGWAYGPVESPVRLAGGVVGPVVPRPLEIVDRRGCDLAPVDVTTEEGRLRLRSFVWPFHVERHDRLSGALDVAQRKAPTVDKASAAEWLETQLAEEMPNDVLTVVWQSITSQYWPADEIERADRAISRAAERSLIAHVSMEYPTGAELEGAVLTIACSGSGSDFEYDRIGTVGDHGSPVTIEPG